MINLYRRKTQQQLGAATLLVATILLVSITLVVLFAGNYSIAQQKISSNTARNLQAFEAAEAGLEYGINYLKQNSATVLATKVSGFVQPYSDSNTTNVTLANGSKYSITYSNPIANNYNLITVTSVGTNDDGTATRTISQRVRFGSILYKTPTSPAIAKGQVTISGSSNITNTTGSNTITSGSTASLSGSSSTLAQGGVTSTSGHINSDIQQNNSTLASQSSADMFASYFGASMATVKSNANYVFTNLSNYSSSLNGITGATIWIDQTSGDARLSGTSVIGSPTAPVLIIVNGNMDMSGSTTIYGIVIVLGTTTTDITGSTNITGGILSTDALRLAGTSNLNYSTSVVNTIQQTLGTYYAKVPGTWRDY